MIYAPDLVDIEKDKIDTLNGLDYFVADGSSLYTNMVRKRNGKLFGHTRVKTEINWCKKYGIYNLIITHCGRQIVTMDEEKLNNKIDEYAGKQVDVKIAYDGYCLEL